MQELTDRQRQMKRERDRRYRERKRKGWVALDRFLTKSADDNALRTYEKYSHRKDGVLLGNVAGHRAWDGLPRWIDPVDLGELVLGSPPLEEWVRNWVYEQRQRELSTS